MTETNQHSPGFLAGGISQVNSLASRKQALVAESELYRQTLATEIQNLRLSVARMRRKFRFIRLLIPMLVLIPLAVSLRGLGSNTGPEKPPSRGWRKWWGAAMLGWRLYQRTAPVVGHLLSRRNSEQHPRRRFGEKAL